MNCNHLLVIFTILCNIKIILPPHASLELIELHVGVECRVAATVASKEFVRADGTVQRQKRLAEAFAQLLHAGGIVGAAGLVEGLETIGGNHLGPLGRVVDAFEAGAAEQLDERAHLAIVFDRLERGHPLAPRGLLQARAVLARRVQIQIERNLVQLLLQAKRGEVVVS